MNGYSIYLDDSGHPEDTRYLALGGFISGEDRWVTFEERWREILQKRGIDFPFHATDFFSQHKNDPKLKHIVADLVRVITNHIEAAFSVVIDINAYKEFNKTSRLEEIAGTPYAIVTRNIHENVNKWQEIVGSRSPLLYFVESGTLHRGDMMECLKDRDGINPPIPVPKSNIGCQAADLYAYSVFQTAMRSEDNPFIAWRYFEEKLKFPAERRDARIFRSDLEAYLSRPTTHIEGIENKIRIPTRVETEGLNFNFKGNPKRIRRATVGMPKKEK